MVLQDRANGFQVQRDRDDDAVLLGQATVDDALAAHFERTIAIAANGPEILTQV